MDIKDKNFQNTLANANPNISITLNKKGVSKNPISKEGVISKDEKSDLESLIELYNQKNFDDLLEKSNAFVLKYPNNTDGLNANALAHKNQKEFKKALKIFDKIININPKIDYVYQNMANIFFDLGNMTSAIEYQKKALELNPKNIRSMNGLGLALSNSGDDIAAIGYYKRALEINSNDSETNYNIATSYRKIEKYKEASLHYSRSDNKKSKSFQLECMYLAGDVVLDDFYSLLEILGRDENLFPIAASVSAHAAVRYSMPDPYPFCKEPFGFIKKFNLYDHKDFNDNLINRFLEDVDNSNITQRGQSLLKNGLQTSGNLFLLEHESVKQMVEIIESKLAEYRSFYENRNVGLVKSWPKKYRLFGWLIQIKSGGSLSSHMHNEGWLSSSIYLKRPNKKKEHDGDIAFCLDGGNFPEIHQLQSEKEIIDISKGDMVSFPSSLFHSTVPFSSDEDRVTLAFDVIPSE